MVKTGGVAHHNSFHGFLRGHEALQLEVVMNSRSPLKGFASTSGDGRHWNWFHNAAGSA